MKPHPRLYVSPDQVHRVKTVPPRGPALTDAARGVELIAEAALKTTDFDYARDVHNEHLNRARVNQGRVVTLIVRWMQTGDRRYRDAAVAHIDAMGAWEYWSWITWRQGNADPKAIFDLSYGENATTLAIAYDLLHADLSPAERKRFQRIAIDRVFPSFLIHTQTTEKKKAAWWFCHRASNWNTVCAGGAGMLALAMHEDVPAAAEALRVAEVSIAPYMLELDKTHGAWPEGIGYWNYGMRYAFMYLLSHENATGKKHPMLRRASVRATLRFPLDFCPNGVPCSFGDVNNFHSLPFHFEAARRLGCDDVLAMLVGNVRGLARGFTSWPDAAEMLLLHPRAIPKIPPTSASLNRHYKGQDWMVLADHPTKPRLYLAARGGTTKVPHSHLDLLSFHCVVGDEAMITNLSPGEYLDTTFSARRWDLFEMRPDSKNTILINGVGITPDSTVTTTPLRFPRLPRTDVAGYRIDATASYGNMRDGAVTSFCARAILMLDAAAYLIIDRVELPHVGRVESRMHTFAGVTAKDAAATLRGARQRMSVSYACDRPAKLFTAQGAPTTPNTGATMLRWCSHKQEIAFTMATLLVPGAKPGSVKITAEKSGFVVAAVVGHRRHRLRLSNRLKPQ